MSNEKQPIKEGLFAATKKFTDAFFDGLKANATNKAIQAAKSNKNVPSEIVNKMSELEKLAKELKDDLEKYS
jgi:hypothetical protein